MGIESDQLVFDYLSRVGDLAQQRQLPSGTRMQLVSSLRNEIDRQRAKYDTDSPAAVRRILGRLGTPDEVVTAAADGAGIQGATGTDPVSAAPRPAVSRPAVPEQRARSGRRFIPRPRRTAKPDLAPPSAASPPHLAGMHELGPSGGEPDWWRVGPGGDSGIGGFVGGVEVAEILRPPPGKDAEEEPDGTELEGAADPVPVGDPETVPARRRWLPRVRRRGADTVRPSLGNPLLLAAAALLVIGTVIGSWLALAFGWLLAYASRTLSRAEAKWAVLGLPGAVAAAAAVWLWGRVNGRWGEPIPPGGDAMAEALATTWPWALRSAAIATALYLVWRARRV
ncbi:hypothetical protein ACFU5O_33295 [Streptomyces sp. NPDC057445]|uniref:hypothetical protein n=1 Tax=Streptomyces sp. NPDC057445 TaxID=3346136 RepID=UPI00367F1677